MRQRFSHTLQSEGKMFGVLVVDIGVGRAFLAAFSGNLAGSNRHDYFVPPIYDLLQPDGYFVNEEAEISAINRRIAEAEQSAAYVALRQSMSDMERLSRMEIEEAQRRKQEYKTAVSTGAQTDDVRQHQFLNAEIQRAKQKWRSAMATERQRLDENTATIAAMKEERKVRSAALQKWLFSQYVVLNAKGERRDLVEIFDGATSPAGTGECCAPKLLNTAYRNGWTPLCMAEFWVGPSPKEELRIAGNYYPACRSKCKPVLEFMLQGLNVEPNPLVERNRRLAASLEVLYECEYYVIVNKPSGMLSVPGIDYVPTVYDVIRQRHPEATGPMIVHRLDMDTSGLMVVALNTPTYHALQRQFLMHTVRKRYTAVIDTSRRKTPLPHSGEVSLPICPNPLDRPRQMVSETFGKEALTLYKIVDDSNRQRVRIHFYPQTGRTHQLRVHSAHHDGLDSPIVGDPLYGQASTRLMLHAAELTFLHPVTKQELTYVCEAPF